MQSEQNEEIKEIELELEQEQFERQLNKAIEMRMK